MRQAAILALTGALAAVGCGGDDDRPSARRRAAVSSGSTST
jgi:hypothetical protein